ncbi:basic region leucine zipper, partial [Ostertagia ostertagi]
MSDISSFAETEQQNFCDAFLPSAALASWGVWGEEEPSFADRTESTLRDRCGGSCVNQQSTTSGKRGNGPKPPPPPLLTSQLPQSPPCHVRPRLAHPRHVLVVDKEGVVSQDIPRIISPSSVLSSSSLSPFSKHVEENHQLSSPYLYENANEYPHMLESPYNLSQSVAKSLSPFEHSASYATSTADSDFDYSHLICSHNIEDFGDDIAYGQSASSSFASPQEVSSQLQATPDFSFIDSIYESTVASPPDATVDVPSTTPVITLGVDSPVTIVAVDGKEYKVVLQEVKQDPKIGAKRKASAAEPKRAPGIPLANMSIEEINARKREQNRVAAQRYREKKRNCKETEKEERIMLEEERLEKRNSFLRAEAVRLQDEIDELRKAILGGVAVR